MVVVAVPNGIVAPRDMLGLTRRQEVNGENYIDLTTTRELAKGDLVAVTSDVDGIAREYMVWSASEPHGQDLLARTYRCVWSLQGILSSVTCSAMPSNKTARQALTSLLADTQAFAIGTVEPSTVASASFWRMSAWEGLAELVKNWGGEVSCDYDPERRTRTVNLLDQVGAGGAFSFYWGSSEIESIERKTADGPEVCRIIPLGAAAETDSGGYGRKIDITSVNGGLPYLEDAEKAAEMAGDPQPTATLYVENPDMTTPADLKAWGQRVLESYTRPEPTYDVRLVERYARSASYVPALGDRGIVYDDALGIALEARVLAITVDELAQSVKAEVSASASLESPMLNLVSGDKTLGGVNSKGIVAASGFSVTKTSAGLMLTDRTGHLYPGAFDNGSNLWIGATGTAARHHTGTANISSGHNGTTGNPSIYISVPNAANDGATNYRAWHDGYQGVSSTSTVSDIIAPESGVNITSATLTTVGKMAFLDITFTLSSALNNNTNVTLGALVQGKRPRQFASGGSALMTGHIYTNGNVVARNIQGSTLPAGTSRMVGFTYIIP